MKKLTRDRVVPIISARVSCVIFGISVSGSPGLPNSAINNRILANRFSLELKELIDKIGPECAYYKNFKNKSENECFSCITQIIFGRSIFKAVQAVMAVAVAICRPPAFASDSSPTKSPEA
jgi:hypothetical protein